MRGARLGLPVVSMLIAIAVRPVAGGDCAEEDRDERGRCPPKVEKKGSDPKAGSASGSAAPGKVVTTPPVAVKRTLLEIRGPEVAGVQVLLDGRVVGRAPLTVEATPAPVRHLVEVKRDGYAPYAEWIEVKKGERRIVEVKLERVTARSVAQPGAVATRPPATCPAEMVRVPAGTFQMGSPAGVGEDDEQPRHAVTLSAYCIDRTEVTVKSYAACVAAKGCAPAPLAVKWGANAVEEEVKRWSRYCNRDDRADHPINCVDWNQAAAYCKWAEKRLPTEAEWEYAARHDPKTNEDRSYPWGNDAPNAMRLNACGTECAEMVKRDLEIHSKSLFDASDGWAMTAPVGSFPAGASPVGALDMAGNVVEWTADWYGTYPAAAVTNPSGVATGTDRVARGSGWLQAGATWVRAADRAKYEPAFRQLYLGFRCARGG